MINKVQWFASAASFVIILVVLDLVRRGKLKESYSLLWLAIGIFMLVASLWERLLMIISDVLGILYPPSTLFLIGILFLVVLLLQISVVVSSLSEGNRKLAQEVSLLKYELTELKKKIDKT